MPAFFSLSWRISSITMLYRSAAEVPPDLALTKDELKQDRARLGGYLARVNALPPDDTGHVEGMSRLTERRFCARLLTWAA
jgi:hypothetical protein